MFSLLLIRSRLGTWKINFDGYAYKKGVNINNNNDNMSIDLSGDDDDDNDNNNNNSSLSSSNSSPTVEMLMKILFETKGVSSNQVVISNAPVSTNNISSIINDPFGNSSTSGRKIIMINHLKNYKKKLSEFGIKHGDMVFMEFIPQDKSSSSKSIEQSVSIPNRVQAAAAKTKKIDANGNVVASDKIKSDASFRPGLSSLRARKLHWTLTDMTELDSEYTFVIKGAKKIYTQSVSLDSEACKSFQRYVSEFSFQYPRCGILYGKYVDALPPNTKPTATKASSASSSTSSESSASASSLIADSASASASSTLSFDPERPPSKPTKPAYGSTKKTMKLKDLDFTVDESPKQRVKVEAIYEPAQIVSAETGYFTLLDDPLEEKADMIAASLGLIRVGFIFSHAPREGYEFSAHEIIQSGIQCLNASDGKRESPFVIVKVTCDETGNGSFDAFQLTPQCLDMVAEEALVPMASNPGVSAIHESFTAIVEAKAAEVVDNDMFIVRVPILSHTSPLFNSFPVHNRDGDPPTIQALAKLLKPVIKSEGLPLMRKLADFHELLFIGEHAGIEMAAHIGETINKNLFTQDGDKANELIPIEEGYILILSHLIES